VDRDRRKGARRVGRERREGRETSLDIFEEKKVDVSGS